MLQFFFFLCIFISRSCGSPLSSLDDIGPVIFVNMLYRHGERTPTQPGNADPWHDPKYWPIGFGQLTTEGVDHHYNLGKWLRSRYIDLIPDGKYNKDIVYIRSTDVDRTLQSAESNLAGMFPPIGDEQWSKSLLWQPIPVHTVPYEYDKILAMGVPCEKYDRIYSKFLKSSEYKKMNSKYKKLYKYISKNYNQTFNSPNNLEWFYSTLMMEELQNYTLPNWTRKVYPDKLIKPAGLSFALETWTTEMKRLKGGPLLKKMIQDMEKKVNSSLEFKRNLSIYSGHDYNIASLLDTLGVYNKIVPPFAALVLLELRKTKDDQVVVTVLYKNTKDPYGEPKIMKLPKCGKVCPLSKFKKIYESVIPHDWDKECNS